MKNGGSMQVGYIRGDNGRYEKIPAACLHVATGLNVYRLNFLEMYTTTPMIFAVSPTFKREARGSEGER